MPQIRPITDLRNTTEISELCHAKNEPIFITKNGYGDLVIMSMETYEKITASPVERFRGNVFSDGAKPHLGGYAGRRLAAARRALP